MKRIMAILLTAAFLFSAIPLAGAQEESPAVNLLLSSCDDGGGWSTEPSRGSLKLSKESAVGSGSIQVDCDTEMFFFLAPPAGALDFTHVTHLDFYFYTEDINIFQYSDCGFDLSYTDAWSSGGVRVTPATLKSLTLTKGWNHLTLPLDFSGQTPQCDLTKIGRMRFYSVGLPAGSRTVRIDEVRAVNQKGLDEAEQVIADGVAALIDKIGRVNTFSEPAISTARSAYEALSETQKPLVKNYDALLAAEAAYQKLLNPTFELLLSDCDTMEGWESRNSVDTEEFVDGAGSIKQTATDTMMYYFIQDEGFDFTGVTHLEMDFYTDDPDIFKHGDSGINIASVTQGSWWGQNGLRVNAADLKALKLTQGWNHLTLPITAVTEPPESFQLNKVTSFRFYAVKQTAGTVFRIDNFKAVGPAGEAAVILPESMEQKPPVSEESGAYLLSSCDSDQELSLSGVKKVVWPKLGSQQFAAFIGLGTTDPVQIKAPVLTDSPVRITGHAFDDLALRVQLYVENAATVKSNGQFELTSGNGPDKNELHWDTKNLNLKDGWNNLYLDFSEGVPTGGTLDIGNINYLRFYLFLTADTVMAVDDIKVVKRAVPAWDENFEQPESLQKWQAEGAALSLENSALKISAPAAGDVEVFTSAYTIPIVHPDRTPIEFQLKTSDASQVQGLSFALTDSAGKRALYTLDQQKLQDGSWVKFMVVPSESASVQDGFDFEKAVSGSFAISFAGKADILLDSVTCNIRQGQYWRDWLYDYQPQPGDYSITVIPDLQEITAVHPQKLTQMFQWIADNKQKENMKFAIGLGDLTWNGHRGTATNEAETEFSRAAAAFSLLDKVGLPYSNAYGNHDYVPGSPRDTSLFNQYFPYAKYSQWDSFGGAMEEGKMDNAYFCFTVGKVPYLVMALEFDPSAKVLEWANQVAEQHPEHNIIVSTHGYLGYDGERLTPTPSPTTGETGHGEEIWQNFVKKHKNIFMVLCGHVTNAKDPGSMAWRQDEGEQGNTVTQVMANAQDIDADRGGVGLLLLLRFTNGGNTIDFNYFSPLNGLAYKEVNQFRVTLPEGQLITIPDPEYTLRFDAGGGAPEPAAQTLKEGAAPAAVNDPRREGYTFLGWFDGDTKVNLSSFTMPAKDVTLTAKWEKAAPDYTLGDINDDGYIDSLDALIALRYSVGLEKLSETELLAADVTKDNVIDSLDALDILRKSVGIITQFE